MIFGNKVSLANLNHLKAAVVAAQRSICNEIKTDYKTSFLNGNFALEPSMTSCYNDISKNSIINLSLSL